MPPAGFETAIPGAVIGIGAYFSTPPKCRNMILLLFSNVNKYIQQIEHCKIFWFECKIEISGVNILIHLHTAVAYPGILFGGVQQIQLRTEDRENGDLGGR